ncbi:MAG: hypothetical protein WCJ64_19010 [Rhodospirillaceae bacterium]
MLDTVIDSKTSSALAAANRHFSEKAAAKGATAAPTTAAAVYTEDAVTVSLSKAAITAAVSHTTVAAAVSEESASPATSASDAATAPSFATAAAQADAQRAQQALATIKQAKGNAASQMKAFLRQKLEGYKKQLQILRLFGTDAREIAKGALKVARGVANAARDYAAATQEERKAGLTGSSDASETEAQAQQDVAAIKAQAAAAPLDSTAGDTPANAPTNPDDRFFYDAFRIMALAKKTIEQARLVDIRQYGNAHAKEFKKIAQRMGELDEAVTKSYVAMKTGGDLKEVDALLKGFSSSTLGPDM